MSEYIDSLYLSGQEVPIRDAKAQEDIAGLGSAANGLEDKNFFNFGVYAKSDTTTNKGVTYTRINETRWTATGTAAETSRYWIFDEETFVHLKAGKIYRVRFEASDGNIKLATYKRVGAALTAVPIVGGILTVPSDATGFMFRMDTASGAVVDATIDFSVCNIPDDIVDLEKSIAPRFYDNLLSGFINPAGETYKNVKYEWNNGVCHVYNPESGGATATSYTDVFSDPNAFPVGMEAGGTYKVSGASEKVQYRFYQAVNGAFVSTPTILTANSDSYLTVPAGTTGLRMRLYVASGVTVDEYITPCIQRTDQPERLVFPHRIAMFGDSIMLGRDGDAEAGVHTLYPIPDTVSKRLGIVCDNLGVGSMGWLAEGSGMNAYGKISTTDLTPYDVIVLCFGVNDGFRAIGNYDSSDETEVMGQFNKVINYIFTQKPAVQVIVIAPFNGCNVGSFPKYWYGTVPSTAYSRGVLSDTLKEACEYYNIPYIEQKDGPLNGFTVKKNILDSNNKSLTYMGADGVHPSNAGYKALGGWISGEIARLIG